MDISNRQKELIKYIVEEYIRTPVPIGSKLIINKYMKNLSAATIRNEMAALEKLGYLEKNHTSSGRVPSNKAYKFYDKEFSLSEIDNNLKFKLKKIFEKRSNSIDLIINESCKVINEALKLPLVTINDNQKITLKRFDLIEISNNSALMIVILSNGELLKNIIEVKNKKLLVDLSICVRIFNDRLVDCNVLEVKDKLKIIQEIVRQQVQSYEFIMQEVVERIFNFNSKITTNIVGVSSLMNLPEFTDHNKLKEVLIMLENTSVWEQILLKQNNSQNVTSIVFGDEIGKEDLLFASTEIGTESNPTKLVMLAPTRIDYSKIKGLLDFVNEEFKKIWNKK